MKGMKRRQRGEELREGRGGERAEKRRGRRRWREGKEPCQEFEPVWFWSRDHLPMRQWSYWGNVHLSTLAPSVLTGLQSTPLFTHFSVALTHTALISTSDLWHTHKIHVCVCVQKQLGCHFHPNWAFTLREKGKPPEHIKVQCLWDSVAL